MMKRIGIFNESRTCPTKSVFFALQTVISTYPGDPFRKELSSIIGEISSSNEQKIQCEALKRGAALLASSLQYTEYCVWDYSFVKDVAHTEFSSWVDDIQRILNAPDDTDDVVPFGGAETSYMVATLVILSNHNSLKSWLQGYPANLTPPEYFLRKTIETMWNRIASPKSGIITNCTNAMLTVSPSSADNFYSLKSLRASEWDYLKPVY